VTIDDDASVLEGLADHCDGLVVAAMGAGHVPFDLVEPLEALADAMPVVLASRTGSGQVLTTTYGFRGSERDLLARRLIHPGTLHPFKARVLLRSLLAAGLDRDAIRAAFTEVGTLANA
jgi:L-asparaginase